MKSHGSIPIPSTQKEAKILITAEVNAAMLVLVRSELKKRNLTLRQVVEWGLSSFLLSSNPEQAKKLGIE
jgi:hypothetical protein